MISKKKKKSIIKDLREKIEKSQAIYFTDFSGVSVPAVNLLRRQLKEKEGLAKVAKKNLMDIAFSRNGYHFDLRNKFAGSLMLDFAFSDPLVIAKLIWKFSKKNKTFKILGGIMDGKFISDEEVKKLAQIPSSEILLGRLVGSLALPIRNLNYVLKGNIIKLVYALSALQRQRA